MATNLYQTSSSGLPKQVPTLWLCVAPTVVPLTGDVQVRVAPGVNNTALAQSSLAGGAGGVPTHKVKAEVTIGLAELVKTLA
ncbi:hypothetical protein D3C86_1367910 [compost metagenome]